MKDIECETLQLARISEFIQDKRMQKLNDMIAAFNKRFGGRCIWNINSTNSGGGVAEMLSQMVAYARGSQVDSKWAVIEADNDFFVVTKRIHNMLHGMPGDGGPLGAEEKKLYDTVSENQSKGMRERVKRGDVVVLHDPQTAGLVDVVLSMGAVPVWRCHVGRDTPNEYTKRAWKFLRPYITKCTKLVFSRQSYVPDYLHSMSEHVTIIAPALDPLSAKNISMDDDRAHDICTFIGVIAPPAYKDNLDYSSRTSQHSGAVKRVAKIVRDGPAPSSDCKLIVQVSRWDRLKDMRGVLTGYAEHVAATPEGLNSHLLLVGPSTDGVADDPEGHETFLECRAAHEALPHQLRRRVSLVSLPMDDREENAAMVNAIQRKATIIVQKSLVEGFGLTVAEAMWKRKPVVASAIGGICDQVVDGVTGILLKDPQSGTELGAALRDLLSNESKAAAFGQAGYERVVEHFLPDRDLLQWADMFLKLPVTPQAE
eukprot:TRINITY_DN2655_c0_g1_i1.p1 TRINITY_DN2655_c0_g1~~TRINITY_DN2655_c0_g1_i1.p1  ORF type:complete len:484 (-),score=94.57 TRINITY_DN2655_c0_g1_i1:558-2009(-)